MERTLDQKQATSQWGEKSTALGDNTGCASSSFTESNNLVLGRMDVEMHPEEPLERSLL